MARSHRFGQSCEDLAAAALLDRGWTVLARNYRWRRKEIDLIVRRGRIVAFVEVKGRSNAAFGHPLDAIHSLKRREIEQVARGWISRHGQSDDVYRFDAVAVTMGSSTSCVDHIADAWRPRA